MNPIDVTLAARADYCRLLAACFYQPDPAFAEERLFASMEEAGRRLGDAFAADARALGEAFAGDDLETLLVDYTRLFVGPGEPLASPYEAAWRGRDGASPVLPVLSVYADGGFAPADDFHDLPDHVAAQLEFCYLALFRQAEALAGADLDGLARWEALQRRLLEVHLGAWVGAFGAAVASGAETAFYRTLGAAVTRFVAGEASRPAG